MPSRKPSPRKPPHVPKWLSGLALAAAFAAAAWLERSSQTKPGGKSADDRGLSARSASQRAHVARSRETGRGRGATSPLQIPFKGWRDILWRTYAQVGRDRLLAVAAGVVFYGLLAIFPAITALVSSYGLFADPATISTHLAFLADLMPAGAFDIVQEQVARIAGQGGGGLSVAFVLGLLIALWSANAGMKAMMDALNVIYDEEEKRSFLTLNLVSLLLTLGGLLILLLAVACVVVLPLALSWIGLESSAAWLIAGLRWPALLVVVTLALIVLYRFGPSRRPARWRWLIVGAVVATLIWLVASALLSFYLSNFADYNATYGSLGAGIGLMMWLWISAIAILLGAELNSEIEHQTARDSTVGRDKPLGRREAVMADTVGKAQ